jgi:iron complex outermembrane receptor protein
VGQWHIGRDQDGLGDNRQFQYARQLLRNAYLKVSGDLFDLPAGPAKIAVGGELMGYEMDQYNIRANNLGIASQSSEPSPAYIRNVQSAYAELYVPLIKDSFIKLLDLNIQAVSTITAILAARPTPSWR